jgi:hypothetical protein
LVTNVVKEGFKDIELHDGGGLNLIRLHGIPKSQEKLISMGIGGLFFLTFGFKDVQFDDIELFKLLLLNNIFSCDT